MILVTLQRMRRERAGACAFMPLQYSSTACAAACMRAEALVESGGARTPSQACRSCVNVLSGTTHACMHAPIHSGASACMWSTPCTSCASSSAPLRPWSRWRGCHTRIEAREGEGKERIGGRVWGMDWPQRMVPRALRPPHLPPQGHLEGVLQHARPLCRPKLSLPACLAAGGSF